MNMHDAIVNERPGVIEVSLLDDERPALMYGPAWLEADHPLPPYVIAGMLLRGSMYVLAGDGGTGKTYLALDMAYHIARGQEWMGREVEQGAVLYLDEQNGPNRMSVRYRQVSRGHGDTEQWPLYTLSMQGANFGTPEDALAWSERLRLAIAQAEEDSRLQVRLVIVDSLLDVSAGADENSAGEMRGVIAAIRDVARTMEAAVLVLHHTQRGQKAAFRGTGEIKNGSDGLFTLAAQDGEAPNEPKPLALTTDKMRDAAPLKLACQMRWSGEQGREGVDFEPLDALPTRQVGRPAKQKLDGAQADLFNALARRYHETGQPFTRADARRIGVAIGAWERADSAGKAFDAMVRRGFIEAVGEGAYKPAGALSPTETGGK